MRLTTLLDMAVDGFGDRVVVGRKADGLTAEQLNSRAAVGAALIEAAGADAVLYLAVNGPAFPVAMFAAAAAGVPLVPVNYRLGVDQLRDLLARHPGAYGIADGEGLQSLSTAGIVGMTPEDWLEVTADDAVTPRDLDVEPERPNDTAVMIYTSGTTSSPKGVLLRHANLVSYVLGTVEFAAASPNEAALVSVPPYHIAAVANVISNLFAGRRTIVLEQFRPDEWLDTVRQEEVTNALVVPTMLSRIIESGGDKSVPTLRNLAYGGAPMPTSVIERALSIWPDVGFVNAYGLTETSSTVAILGAEDHREAFGSPDPRVRSRLSSVGKVLPSVDLEIRDVYGVVVPAGVTGRILVRGEQVSAEYAGVGSTVDADGFFDTRDEGYVDHDGYLFIGGRTDDTIIRGAENIAPAEIEEVLLRHPSVIDAAVVGVPDDEWGQRLEAAVVTRAQPAVDSDELGAYVRASLRSSKTPSKFWFLSELPRTETGKLLRRKVLEKVLLHDSRMVGG